MNNQLEIDIVPAIDTIMQFELEKIIMNFDEQFFYHLSHCNFAECEHELINFCLELSFLNEEKQLFIAKTTLKGIVTHIVTKQSQNGFLQLPVLAKSYNLINYIEQLPSTSAIIVFAPSLIKEVRHQLIVDHLFFTANPYVASALQLINENLTSQLLSVNWLAAELNITSTHLTNLFKTYLRDTVSTYIAKQKIKAIIYDLTYLNKTVKDVRYKYNFTDHSHFIQFFKRMKGLTPLEFMKEHVNQ